MTCAWCGQSTEKGEHGIVTHDNLVARTASTTRVRCFVPFDIPPTQLVPRFDVLYGFGTFRPAPRPVIVLMPETTDDGE